MEAAENEEQKKEGTEGHVPYLGYGQEELRMDRNWKGAPCGPVGGQAKLAEDQITHPGEGYLKEHLHGKDEGDAAKAKGRS
jgi:hypothetical protein